MKKNLDPKQLQRRLKRMTAVYLTVFLAIILLISLYINQNSFQSQYEANELSFYSVSGSRLVSLLVGIPAALSARQQFVQFIQGLLPADGERAPVHRVAVCFSGFNQAEDRSAESRTAFLQELGGVDGRQLYRVGVPAVQVVVCCWSCHFHAPF